MSPPSPKLPPSSAPSDVNVQQRPPEIPELVLGWTINSAMVPVYWLSKDAKPGGQSPAHLVTASAKDMAYHTVIVAQSGSGKSFFLGRILEELALKTRARLIVLDPNADFRRMGDVVGESWWQQAGYDLDRGRGKVPHEPSRAMFESAWKTMHPEILSGPYLTPQGSSRLRVSWDAFPIAFLAEDLDAIDRSQVYHCHKFVTSIAFLEKEIASGPKDAGTTAALDKARKLLQRSRHEDARQVLEEEFPSSEIHRVSTRRLFSRWWRETRLTQARESAISAVKFISHKIERDGYLLHSPNPYRLWFRVGFNSGVKDPSQGNGQIGRAHV